MIFGRSGRARVVSREASSPRDGAPDEARRLELRARRLLDSQALGAYESVFRGHGVEFAEVRAYQPGDPFQAIDWKVTARMRRPYVKRFVEERELVVLLAVDLSASTRFGTRQKLKRDLGLEVAAALGLAALRTQNRVGLLLFTGEVERYVPAARGRNRLLRLLHELVSFRPAGRGTDLPAALGAASQLLSSRSLVFVLSDFRPGEANGFAHHPTTAESDGLADGEEGGALLERALLGLSRRHDVVGIEIRDPAESRLPSAGLLEVEDPETGYRRVLDLGDAATHRALEAEARREDQQLEALFRRSRTDRVVLRTDRPWVPELAAFFGARARQKRRR